MAGARRGVWGEGGWGAGSAGAGGGRGWAKVRAAGAARGPSGRPGGGPRHYGTPEQPKNAGPWDRLARRTIDEPQVGHSMAIK